MLIGADEIGQAMRLKVERSGLGVLRSESPWFPPGFNLSTSLFGCDVNHWEPHQCSHEPTIELPAIWVFPIKFWDEYERKWRLTSNGGNFQPYIIYPIVVVHAGMRQPDSEKWRQLTPAEGACGVAEFPQVGSLQCPLGWVQSTCQAYRDTARGKKVSVNCRTDPYRIGHHAAYTLREHVPHPPTDISNTIRC